MEEVAFGVGLLLGLGVCIGIETIIEQEGERRMFGLVLSAVAKKSITSALAGGAVASMTTYVAVKNGQ